MYESAPEPQSIHIQEQTVAALTDNIMGKDWSARVAELTAHYEQLDDQMEAEPDQTRRTALLRKSMEALQELRVAEKFADFANAEQVRRHAFESSFAAPDTLPVTPDSSNGFDDTAVVGDPDATD